MTQPKVLLSEEKIQQRLVELAAEIKTDLSQRKVNHVIVLGILKGSFIFMADLVRKLSEVSCECEFLGVSSYGDATVSSGEVKITHDITKPVKGQHILLVEDIADTGLTLNFIQKTLHARGAASVRTAVCLVKRSQMKTPCQLDYVGFEIGPQFVVGYGLDHAGKMRHLPFIGVVQEA